MKKLLTLVLTVLLVACVGVVAFAEDTSVCAFDAEDIAAFMNYNTGLAGYGVADPVVSAADGDDGQGVRVQGETDAAWVQGFNIEDEAFITALRAGVTGNKYLKLYVNNTSEYGFGLRLTLNAEDMATVATFDASHCVLAAKDGYKRETTTADGGGMGKDAAVIIPAGFDGYVYFDCSNITIPYPYKNPTTEEDVPLMTDYNQTAFLEVDLRWNVVSQYKGGADVIFDSLTAVDEITEELIDPTPEPTVEPTAEPTDEPDATAEPTVAPTEAPTKTVDDSADEGSFPIWIIIAAVVVVAVVVVVIVVSKKKKD